MELALNHTDYLSFSRSNFLIYVDQALNGYSMAYSWSNYMALLIFMMLPFFVVHRLKEALVYYKYIP